MFAEHLGSPAGDRQREFSAIVERVHAAIEQLQRMPQPVVASVHGAVAGFGLSLMGACDLALAADTAYFTSAYRHIGLTPDGGSTWTLPRLVGTKKAMEIVLLGERFDAQEALRLGLVNRVVRRCARCDRGARRRWRRSRNGDLQRQAMINQSLSQSLSASLQRRRRVSARAPPPDFAGIRAFSSARHDLGNPNAIHSPCPPSRPRAMPLPGIWTIFQQVIAAGVRTRARPTPRAGKRAASGLKLPPRLSWPKTTGASSAPTR